MNVIDASSPSFMSDSSGLEMQPSWTILLVTGTDWVRQTIAMKITTANETIVFRDIIPNFYLNTISSELLVLLASTGNNLSLIYCSLKHGKQSLYLLPMIFIADGVHCK